MKKRVAILILVLVSSLLACPPTEREQVEPVPQKITEVSLPANIFAPADAAVAYRVDGKGRLSGVRLSAEPLIKERGAVARDFLLFTYSNGRYRAIQHRRNGNELIADLDGGRTYIVALRPTGHLFKSLNTVCRLKLKWEPVPAVDRPRICQLILCAPELIDERTLLEEFEALDMAPGFAPGGLGGWIQPTNYCDLCTRPEPFDPPDFTPPTLNCFTPPSSVCEVGTLLMNADFDADTIGAPPSTSPAGPPPDDSLVIAGDVTVVAGPSGNTVRVARTTTFGDTDLEAILGSGATASGSYCVSFTARVVEDQRTMGVAFESVDGHRAWQMGLGPPAGLLSGAGVQALAVDPHGWHVYRFDIDLDLRVLDLLIDGNPAATGLPLLDASFTVPGELRFHYVGPILEAFPGASEVDEIAVRKTN